VVSPRWCGAAGLAACRAPGIPSEVAVRRPLLGQQITVTAARQLRGAVAAHGRAARVGPHGAITTVFPRPSDSQRRHRRSACRAPRVAALRGIAAAAAVDARLFSRRRSRHEDRPAACVCRGSASGPLTTSRCVRCANRTRFPRRHRLAARAGRSRARAADPGRAARARRALAPLAGLRGPTLWSPARRSPTPRRRRRRRSRMTIASTLQAEAFANCTRRAECCACRTASGRRQRAIDRGERRCGFATTSAAVAWSPAMRTRGRAAAGRARPAVADIARVISVRSAPTSRAALQRPARGRRGDRGGARRGCGPA